MCQKEKLLIAREKAQAVSELEERRFSNVKLTKDIAVADIKVTGITFTNIIVTIGVLFINNLIWIIMYRRKQ